MYLVDTNIWLERFLNQERSEEVGYFLDHTLSDRFFISDFALHSIGVVMSKLNQMGASLSFVRDAFIDGSVSLIHVAPEDMQDIARAAERFNLDFDDAYQYAVAEKYDLVIVSFDSDFDRTDLGRKVPAEVIQG